MTLLLSSNYMKLDLTTSTQLNETQCDMKTWEYDFLWLQTMGVKIYFICKTHQYERDVEICKLYEMLWVVCVW